MLFYGGGEVNLFVVLLVNLFAFFVGFVTLISMSNYAALFYSGVHYLNVFEIEYNARSTERYFERLLELSEGANIFDFISFFGL